jgi:multiple sugar transport system permease protein
MSLSTSAIWPVLAFINLAATLPSYSFLAYALARLRWRGRGTGLVLLTIIVSGQIWLIPQAVSITTFGWRTALYSIWFGNWLVSGFAIVLLCQVLKDVPRDLADAARLDGCGTLGIYWHVILPLVRPALLLLAILTIMATWIAFAAPLISVTNQRFPDVLRLQPGGANLWILMTCSLLMTLPLIAIFFFAQRYFLQPETLTDGKNSELANSAD